MKLWMNYQLSKGSVKNVDEKKSQENLGEKL